MSKHSRLLPALFLSILIMACDTGESNLEECGNEDTGVCVELVSCCDLVLSEDPSGESEAGASCLTDQLVALDEIDSGNSDGDSCATLLSKPEYALTCFSCSSTPAETDAQTGASE